VRKATRPAIFKWRQTAPELIVCAVRWYLRYSLSLRDVEELLDERGLKADQTTVWRWVQRYGPELEQRLRRHLKPTNKSWRVDETYVRVMSTTIPKEHHSLSPAITGPLAAMASLTARAAFARALSAASVMAERNGVFRLAEAPASVQEAAFTAADAAERSSFK
jgi:hypothetical protein